jgi:hypothetical protein
MDHSHYPRGSGSYYRISGNELLEDYLLAVDELTIMDERRPLTKVSNIGQKSNEHDHLLIEELRKKDNQIKDMWEKINEIEASRNENRKEILQYIKCDHRHRVLVFTEKPDPCFGKDACEGYPCINYPHQLTYYMLLGDVQS